jgi:hypothetical protein
MNAMVLPFTTAQFWDVMRDYNDAVWPAQLALNALAVVLVMLLGARARARHRWIAAGLASLLAWSGVVYHWLYFSRVNPAAGLFGLLLIAAGAILAWQGAIEARLRFEFDGLASIVAASLVVYSLVIYPALALAAGHDYPRMPTFGAPCPTTIFAIGMLGFLRAPYPRYVFALPIVWALIGGQAAYALGVYEDYGLAIAALAAVGFALRPRFRERPA